MLARLQDSQRRRENIAKWFKLSLLVQGIVSGNFLMVLKHRGAPPPRQVIVQQCICDRGVLEALCNYASPSKKFYPSKAVISFCTVVEVLGSLTTLDDDGVKRVLPYVLSGLQLDAKGSLDLKFLLYTKLNIRKQHKTVFFEARCVLRMLKCNPRMMVDGSMDEILCRILDGNLDLSIDISDSKIKIWFALEHPKLWDDDLTVVHGALTVNRLDVCICPPALIDALENVLQSCLGIVKSIASGDTSLPSDVAFLCLERAISNFQDQKEFAKNDVVSLAANCKDVSRFNALYDACYQVLVTEWNVLKSVGLVSAEESGLVKLLIIWFCYVISSPKTRMVDGDCKGFLDQLFEANFDTNFRQLNSKILVCLFWRILEVFVSTMPADVSLSPSGAVMWMLLVSFRDVGSSNSVHVGLTSLGVSVAVQVESLHCFVFLCSLLDESLHFELLGEFPSLLVPLSSDNKDLRVAAMSCIEGLCTLSPHVDYTKWKSGINTMPFLLSEASDKDVLPSFLTTLLSSSCHSLLVPETIGQRFSSSIASPSKKFYPSKAVISFCTVVEVLGSLTTLDDDGVKRVLPYVLSGLQLDAKGSLDLKFLLYTKLNIRKQHKTVFFEARCVLRMLKCNPRMMVDGSMDEILCRILDGNLDLSIDISDSKIKIWFALEHPKLWDDDLTVVHAALTVNRLDVCICPPALIDALENVLQSCLGIVMSIASGDTSLPSDVAFLCLERAISNFQDQKEFAKNDVVSLAANCKDVSRFNALYDACYQVLVTEWNVLKSVGLVSAEEDLRVAAMSCIEGLCTLSPHVDYTKWKSGINTMPFLLSEASDKDVLPSFLTTLLSSSCHSLLVPETIGQRFSSSIVSCSTVVRILDSVFEQEVCTIGSPYGKKKKKKKHMSHLNQNSGRTGKNEISFLSSLVDFFAAEERFKDQWNSDSQRVFEVLISAIVPCWLSKNGSIDTLLQLIQQIEIGTCGLQSFKELLVAMQFISEKLLDPEITFKLSSGEESNDVQALGLLSETVKDSDTTKLNHGRKGLTLKSSSWVHVDDSAVESFGEMCLEIVKLVDDSLDDSSTSLKVAAVSAMTGALINVLGPRALPELPSIMENVMSRSHIVSLFVSAITNYGEDSSSTLSTSSKEPLFTSILLAFEAVIDKLDGFLNPYLGDILKLMVLNPKFLPGSDPKLKLKADVVRKLITEKITIARSCGTEIR
ncbi:hypothetical protein RHMOL_Rhmol03G0152200 [Rhododendron molle]|uniref:Uncharacterized protein n=4 Tax=Rhododendron molle TaxID=49168 RepID=A0ACC0PEM5_RHOML|nr:hypothetical protein RHMOL_Rhmol03G0152200 [Rhododendron molle]KAI8564024.1 hypothetical protein RHMOL_Rhmol03G0152200 [Rhododendron molle]KAI8564025.1 hypothetical protein RHMOL_Rhmol03G0152200 [Rhododendron molle]KAI8564026.1 hypothetical protein RHMOL_Rhmol03G0152200 [Rhododendron molle]